MLGLLGQGPDSDNVIASRPNRSFTDTKVAYLYPPPFDNLILPGSPPPTHLGRRPCESYAQLVPPSGLQQHRSRGLPIAIYLHLPPLLPDLTVGSRRPLAMSSPISNTRARSNMSSSSSQPNGTPQAAPSSSSAPPTRNPPFLPTPLEAALLLAYPLILGFGTLFSILSPTVRNAPYDHGTQSHSQDPAFAPSYFARKSNVFNVYFVKRGWLWITAAFFVFLFTHPATAAAHKRTRGVVRWALVTGWWVLVTQWCFGPAIIDRGFRFTGGKCEVADIKLEAGVADGGDIFTNVACKAAGGRWSGGHDISGHVFLLVLGSFFLVQEVGWVYLNHWRRGAAAGPVMVRDERSVVMRDGAVKSAAVEAALFSGADEHRVADAWEALAFGGKFAGAVIFTSWWMLLMTAIFFHTWFEKVRCPPCSW